MQTCCYFFPMKRREQNRKEEKLSAPSLLLRRTATLPERAAHLHASESSPSFSLEAFGGLSCQPALPLRSRQGHSYLPEHCIHSPVSPQLPLHLTHRQCLAVLITPCLFRWSLHKSPGPRTLLGFLFHHWLPRLLGWLPFILTLEAPSTQPV